MDENMYSVVYNHLKNDFEQIAKKMYGGFVPHPARPLIRDEALKDTLEMVRRGNIKEYYERIKNNAI